MTELCSLLPSAEFRMPESDDEWMNRVKISN